MPKGDFELADGATLRVTETLATVHRHVKSPECEPRLRTLPEGGVRVAVADRSPELPVRYTEPDWDTESGRGVFLIASMASQWGVTPGQGRRGKQVGAEFTAVKS
ncbi:ATP-binding protein [Streptomyces sp. NBC_00989]|uniref:ATP-binding protein n=1 Tax=Streptomyces sp. NBC_00989 TaxID=2903705 RepID=UPI00386F197E|nr:ATP-binding protein [Streptomyces sp. NBC_00989]